MLRALREGLSTLCTVDIYIIRYGQCVNKVAKSPTREGKWRAAVRDDEGKGGNRSTVPSTGASCPHGE